MWNTEIFFARKMKFLFDKKLFRWFDQPSNRCTYNHGRIHNFFVDVALFRRLSNVQRSKTWKAGTSNSSPFLMKNVTFLFDKKYLHDSVQRFESLLVIMHSPCKTPRIRFSGCFQFSRLVRWGCRYRKPPRMNFNGEENRASYFEAVPLPKSNENISRPWNRILVPGNKGQNRVETVGQPGWNRRSRNKWILPDRDSRPISRCKPINKLDWQRTNQVQGSK